MSFYRAIMKNASVILFGIAIISFLAAFSSVIFGHNGFFAEGTQQFENAGLMRFKAIGLAISAGLSAMVWPLFGAALLALLERKLPEAAE